MHFQQDECQMSGLSGFSTLLLDLHGRAPRNFAFGDAKHPTNKTPENPTHGQKDERNQMIDVKTLISELGAEVLHQDEESLVMALPSRQRQAPETEDRAKYTMEEIIFASDYAPFHTSGIRFDLARDLYAYERDTLYANLRNAGMAKLVYDDTYTLVVAVGVFFDIHEFMAKAAEHMEAMHFQRVEA